MTEKEGVPRHKLQELILPELYGRLWHTTHPERFNDVLASGAILPRPAVRNPDAWKTLSGEIYCPYACKLGGVSLFDFDHFDPESYTKKCPMSSWYEFVPYRSDWDCAIWIEIDREQVAPQVISGSDLLARQKSEGAERHAIMSYIEAAHLGPLPRTSFKRAFLVGKGDSQLRPLPI